MIFGLFRKGEKKILPTLSAEDQRICDEYEAACHDIHKRRNFMNRSLTVAERARARAAYDLALERWSASDYAYNKMIRRLTDDARNAIKATGATS